MYNKISGGGISLDVKVQPLNIDALKFNFVFTNNVCVPSVIGSGRFHTCKSKPKRNK